jgi:peptide/nickel transport system substrate-binding protein
VPLSLSLLTNSDNDLRTQLAWLLAQQWEASGIDIRFEQQPFDAIADRLLRQQYDVVLIGWDNLGPEPANSDFWHSRYDAPGDGANFVSYQNPQVDDWLDQARTNPTCDTAGRGKLYRQVQQQIAQDLPYILISGQVKQWAYPKHWQELTPYPWRFDYNSHQWWKP